MSFISLVTWKICIFHSWLRHSWNINIFHFTRWNKSHIQQKQNEYPPFICKKLLFLEKKPLRAIFICLERSCKILKGYTEMSRRSWLHKVFTISTMVNILWLELQSGITLAILTLQSIISYKTCSVWWLRCDENFNKLVESYKSYWAKTYNVDVIIESQIDGITESRTGWKHSIPPPPLSPN